MYDIEVNPGFNYRIINFIGVFSVILNVVVCKVCKSQVKFTKSGKRGLEFKIVVSCEKCVQTEIPSGPFIEKGYEINRRIVISMRLLGIGLLEIKKFCAFMELPRSMFHSFYDKVVNRILTVIKMVCKNSMMKAAKDETTISIEKGESGIMVSSDSSWRKSGFTFLFGLVTLIGNYSAKIIDCAVKSKYCKVCGYWKNKQDIEEYTEWTQNHKDNVNHDGSAGKME
ncbi:uncharacterized protein LOC122522965 isoform X2 [Polistes fuscatus]|nr:uncharacterized protein LOC122522965 isoform X2 [Polistes fuscatus]